MTSRQSNTRVCGLRMGLFTIALATGLMTSLVQAGDLANPYYSGYHFGGSLYNTTGITTEGFIYRFDSLDTDDIAYVETGNTPSFYPQSDTYKGDASSTLDVWWYGSTTPPNGIGSFFVSFNSPVLLTGTAAWLNESGSGMLGPVEPIFGIDGPEWNVARSGGRLYVTVSLRNSALASTWVQRRFNHTREHYSLDELARNESIWRGGILLDANPIRLRRGQSLVHRKSLDPRVADYFLSYDVYEDDRGRPGRRVGTFFSSVEMTGETG